MLRALLAKDLRRAWRNPIPWLINLALPLCITGLIGLIFGGHSDTGLGRIRFAVVDEDNSMLTRALRGGFGEDRAGKYLDPVFLDRAEALRQVNHNSLSAALIIPTNFTRNYLTGRAQATVELVKNPAESIHPAVLEELVGALVTGLNALARNFQSEFPAWRAAWEQGFDYQKLGRLVDSAGRKLEAAGKYLKPPLVVYERDSDEESKTSGNSGESRVANQGASTNGAPRNSTPGATGGRDGSNHARTKAKDNPAAAIFAYLLPGLSAMFLLFIAANAVSDLLRELRFRTFERYLTLRQRLLPFVLGKILFALLLLVFAAVVLLGGGAIVFRIHWTQPLALGFITFAYAGFATALMAFFVALMPDERRAGALTNIAGMILGMAGGCMFPREQLPRFLSDHVTPLLPSAWFVEAARQLQFGGAVSPGWVAAKLAIAAAAFLAAAVLVFRRRFRSGARA